MRGDRGDQAFKVARAAELAERCPAPNYLMKVFRDPAVAVTGRIAFAEQMLSYAGILKEVSIIYLSIAPPWIRLQRALTGMESFPC
jgi:hypothetical protein